MFKIIGAGQGSGSRRGRTSKAADHLKTSFPTWPWETVVSSYRSTNRYDDVLTFSQKLASHTAKLIQHNQKPLVLGGDHSIAMGTWSGVTTALNLEGQFGLIWVDAHMDSHTLETSPSGNIHGMPIAYLMKQKEDALANIINNKQKLNPKHIVMLGIRSFEKAEKALLEKLGVRVYYMQEIEQRGFKVCFNEALSYLEKEVKAFGVSLDIDALDPKEAPGTGCFEPNGLKRKDVLDVFKKMRYHPKLKAVEIAEYNPYRDAADKRTKKFIEQAVNILLEENK